MATKPTPGGSDGTWGTDLNDFLNESLASDGKIKDGAVLEAATESGDGDRTVADKGYVDDEITAAVPDDDAFGSWTTATQGSSTQAASDGFILIVIDEDIDTGDILTIKTDSANPPTTIRVAFQGFNTGASGRVSMMCPVKKDDYYLIEDTGLSPTAFWLPIGA